MKKKVVRRLILELSEEEANAIVTALERGEYSVDVNSEARDIIVRAQIILREFVGGVDH
ncbi:hypothetical protein YTCETSXE_CDS0035 [Staphylococcus phage MVC_VPHSA2]|uniref:Uncharacterized protein n=1 Tax=Staphylococcus phage MVC_VPHSA1 TaxID=3088876 RepID=A0ABZ0QZT9_9CAUD|nr:hypothetical protein FBHYGVHD_CDS0098 [Staphylococcus phage MVC_VPHSA1]WPF64991.1 hypothetical protein YTCETSXE_CDS0035 [Staphylococcus phage MVC_VPHSA2]